MVCTAAGEKASNTPRGVKYQRDLWIAGTDDKIENMDHHRSNYKSSSSADIFLFSFLIGLF